MDNKIKTVVASVLKPVDDTRMYEKLGLSLLQTNRYEVNIIGFTAKNPPLDNDIRFFPIFSMKRTSYQRLLVTFRLFYYMLRIRPTLIILTTYEILPAALLFKLYHPACRLVYDIQENYALNILSNQSYSLKARLIAKGIRKLETFSQKFISLNILAERCYAKELSFLAKSVVILNKAKQPQHSIWQTSTLKHAQQSSNKHPVLIFCGTISKDYGVFQAICLAEKLVNFFPELIAKFIGQVHDSTLLKKLKKNQNPHLLFHIDTQPVPHPQIMYEMAVADFGLVAHQPTPSIRNCFPTRIYELMSLNKPIILQEHPLWTNYCKPWDACIPIDYNNFDAEWVAEQMKQQKFYKKGKPDDIYWESEEEKLIKAIDSLFLINY